MEKESNRRRARTWLSRTISKGSNFNLCISSEENELSGWLLKKGHVVKNIKKRWFVLDLSSKTLSYYINPEAASAAKKPKGIIQLEGASIAVDVKQHEFAFYISSSKKSFYLQDSSKESKDKWIQKLTSIEGVRKLEASPSSQELIPPRTSIHSSSYPAKILRRTDRESEFFDCFAISGEGLESELTLGSHTFFINASAKEVNLDLIFVCITDRNGKDIPNTLLKKDSKTHQITVQYTLSSTGEYIIQIRFKEDIVVDYSIRAFTELEVCSLELVTSTHFPRSLIGEQTDLLFQAFNVKKSKCKQGGERILANLVQPKKENKLIPVTVIDNRNGTYSISYTLTQSGSFDFTIVYANKQSSYTVICSSKDEKENCIIVGGVEQLEKSFVNEVVEFQVKIQNKSSSGESLLVEMKGKELIDVIIEESETVPGLFHVSYIAPKSGVYLLTIEYEGIPIRGCPVIVTVFDTKQSKPLTLKGFEWARWPPGIFVRMEGTSLNKPYIQEKTLQKLTDSQYTISINTTLDGKETFDKETITWKEKKMEKSGSEDLVIDGKKFHCNVWRIDYIDGLKEKLWIPEDFKFNGLPLKSATTLMNGQTRICLASNFTTHRIGGKILDIIVIEQKLITNGEQPKDQTIWVSPLFPGCIVKIEDPNLSLEVVEFGTIPI